MSTREPAPFVVERDGPGWTVIMRVPHRRILWCDSQAEAIDYVYANWPWWP